MDQRETELREWAGAALGVDDGDWSVVVADASSRRYFRLRWNEQSAICADSPPATENNAAFLRVRQLLEDAALPVPAMLAKDLDRGFLVLEDLGDRHLQQVLATQEPSPDYCGALPMLLKLQAIDLAGSGLPHYDRELLSAEFSRFEQWFCQAFLKLPDTAEQRECVSAMGDLLVEDALGQPVVFVYRDYHCRNLLLRPTGQLGLIDFQDAVQGPLCYDLASLLKDCYLRWEPRQVSEWVRGYRQQLLRLDRPAGSDEAEFMRWFDWIGLHRHLKVLGNFTRLALRDGKRGYLADVPLVLRYIREVLPRYPQFRQFADWFERDVMPRADAFNWGGDS